LEPGETGEFCFFYTALFRNQIDEVVVIDANGNEFRVPDGNLQRIGESALLKLSAAQQNAQPDAQNTRAG